jgi:hypothetical protein
MAEKTGLSQTAIVRIWRAFGLQPHPDFHGRSTAAEIALHPNSRFLYASNRVADHIVLFSIEAATQLFAPGRDPGSSR